MLLYTVENRFPDNFDWGRLTNVLWVGRHFGGTMRTCISYRIFRFFLQVLEAILEARKANAEVLDAILGALGAILGAILEVVSVVLRACEVMRSCWTKLARDRKSGVRISFRYAV